MEPLKVFISHRDSTCDECGEELGHRAWITLNREKGALCLTCADLDHLLFLPSGNVALTRRAGKYSTLTAVVLKWSRARKWYERQGLLVTEEAVERAERECLADQDLRERRREREAERRAEQGQQYIRQFATRVRELFPGCPPGREHQIAEHACLKYSGRVGRSAAAKALDEDVVRIAVIAHLRHRETQYDELLMQGWERHDARAEIRLELETALTAWEARD